MGRSTSPITNERLETSVYVTYTTSNVTLGTVQLSSDEEVDDDKGFETSQCRTSADGGVFTKSRR